MKINTVDKLLARLTKKVISVHVCLGVCVREKRNERKKREATNFRNERADITPVQTLQT